MEIINKLRERRAELVMELEALDKALEVVEQVVGSGHNGNGDHVAEVATPTTRTTKASQGFLSEEAKHKISVAQKRIWAERKRAMQVERGEDRRKSA